jgi:excisionase family DNA binding protein
MSLAEAAKVLGLSERTVSRVRERGELAYRVTPRGYKMLYRTSVEDYLASNVDTPSESV